MPLSGVYPFEIEGVRYEKQSRVNTNAINNLRAFSNPYGSFSIFRVLKIILKQIAMNGAGLKFFYILFLQYELCSKLLGYARCSSSYVSACF